MSLRSVSIDFLDAPVLNGMQCCNAKQFQTVCNVIHIMYSLCNNRSMTNSRFLRESRVQLDASVICTRNWNIIFNLSVQQR
jgi:hypothetical protein